MRALTRAPTHTQRVQLEQSGSYRIVDRDHVLSPCTPLNTKPAGISTRPPLKMSHTKVCSHWLAPHTSATIATHLKNSFNIGAQTAFCPRTSRDFVCKDQAHNFLNEHYFTLQGKQDCLVTQNQAWDILALQGSHAVTRKHVDPW
jgi:hypothetical protein